VLSSSAEISHWNRLMTSTLEFFKNRLINLRKQEDRTLWLSRGKCSYMRTYVNAVAKSVMLYLQHDFYNIIFKNKLKFYLALVSAPPPPPPKEKFWARTWLRMIHKTRRDISSWIAIFLSLLVSHCVYSELGNRSLYTVYTERVKCPTYWYLQINLRTVFSRFPDAVGWNN
jgi:hypothetical protein